jgi:UPF0755 protein
MAQHRKRPDTTRTVRTASARSPNERLEPGRAPSRPRGVHAREPSHVFSRLARAVSGALTICLVVMLIIGGTALTMYHQYDSPGPLQAKKVVVIPKGEGRIEIAERLEKEGVITNRWTFVGGHLLQAMFGHTKNSELKAGEYEIKDHASMRDVIETLEEGKSILYRTTLPEGLTSEQIVQRLRAEPSLSGEISDIPPEGTLLPDTYYFAKGAPRQEIIDRMQEAMTKVLAEIWEQRDQDLPLSSPQELVTFASIVEKETGRSNERDHVASVFYNRLKKGMRLQSDPTIIYGIVGGQGALGRGITKADIESTSPYNTYQISGLPPGPICNPGRSALLASAHPAKSDDLYFVANGNGGHAFSSTLKEHNSAVQKWREYEKEARARAEAEAKAAEQASEKTVPIPASASGVGDEPKDKASPSEASDSHSGTEKQASAGTASATSPANVTDIPLPIRKPKTH